TRIGPATRDSGASPQQKLWLQKSFGSGGRRTTRQSFTTGCQVLPPSVKQSMKYATSGDGGFPDACHDAAYTRTAFSPRGVFSSSVVSDDSIFVAEITDVPPARK